MLTKEGAPIQRTGKTFFRFYFRIAQFENLFNMHFSVIDRADFFRASGFGPLPEIVPPPPGPYKNTYYKYRYACIDTTRVGFMNVSYINVISKTLQLKNKNRIIVYVINRRYI